MPSSIMNASEVISLNEENSDCSEQEDNAMKTDGNLSGRDASTNSLPMEESTYQELLSAKNILRSLIRQNR